MQAALASRLGNLDFSASSVLSQLTGIFADALAAVDYGVGAVYASQFPSGATGVAVDNILAINNLSRLPAAATVTDPTPTTAGDGTVRYGLVLLGTPGTVVPAGTLLTNGQNAPATFATDRAATIVAGSNARQSVYLQGVPTDGAYQLSVKTPSGETLTTAPISFSAGVASVRIAWSTPPTSGNFKLKFGDYEPETVIPYNVTAAGLQSLLTDFVRLQSVTVTGSVAAGFVIALPGISAPTVTASLDAAPDIIELNSAQTVVQGLRASDGSYPFADVAISGTPQALRFSFGAIALSDPKAPTTANAQIARIAVASNSLTAGNARVPITVRSEVLGAPDQAIATATCQQPGPVFVAAGQLTTIATPIAGLESATNQLDCLTGRDVETDTEALARLKAQAGSSAGGSLGAVIGRVQAVRGVTQVVGFQNTTNAAQQVVAFASPPITGSFALAVAGQATASLAYNASPADLQAALQSLPGLSQVTVASTGSAGYTIDFVGVRGGQGLDLLGVASNTTQQTLSVYFGRPAHSIEIVAQGGTDAAVAQAIYDAAPAGIATYGAPTLRTTATLTAGSTQMPCTSVVGVSVGQYVEAVGVAFGTSVVDLSGATVTLSQPALQSGSNVAVAFDTAATIADAAGNSVQVAFSRPTQILITVRLDLVTNSDFDPASLSQIADGLIALVNAVPIGGLIRANGTNSLGGSFRQVPGIDDYTLLFDRVDPPQNAQNLQMAGNEVPVLEAAQCVVTFS